MNQSLRIPVILFCALAFSYLFYGAGPGINWFIFNCLLIGATFLIDHKRISKLRIISSAALFITSLSFALHGMGWSFFVSIIALLVYSGVTAEPYFRSLALTLPQSLMNGATSGVVFVRKAVFSSRGIGRVLTGSVRYYYLAVPLVVILVFVSMYSVASPFFEQYLGVVGRQINNGWILFNDHFNWQWFWLFVLGLLISAFILMPYHSQRLNVFNSDIREKLVRRKNRFMATFGLLGLKKEYRSAIFLLVALNVLILFFNVLDIYHVWFNFEWNGQYLKQFVHEGTWMLVSSIFISIALVLYYFRGNLNYYPSRRSFRMLTYAWIAQNAFLALSVGVRNWYYLQHFSLAYKRVAMVFFLALVLIGLYTVYVKVRDQKTRHFLFRTNLMAIFLVLVVSSTINWDVLITRYNFAHHKTGYLHFDYLFRMDSSALPYMDYDSETLLEMEAQRDQRHPVVDFYVTADKFHELMQEKKKRFKENYATKSWKEWNLADARAMAYLEKQEE